MSQSQPIDRIRERIREMIREREAGHATPVAGLDTGGGPRHQDQPAAGTAGAPAPLAQGRSTRPVLALHDLATLREQVNAALATHGQVGQLNPRNAGVLNDGIQFGKKVMRRSLTWYTRPLHAFQRTVVRALQEITSALQSHQWALRTVSKDVAVCNEKMENFPAGEELRTLQARSARLEQEVAVLRREFEKLHREHAAGVLPKSPPEAS